MDDLLVHNGRRGELCELPPVGGVDHDGIVARLATLEDWPQIRTFWEKFLLSPHVGKADVSMDLIQAFFTASLLRSWVQVWILTWGPCVVGSAITHTSTVPTGLTADGKDVEIRPYTYVRILHVRNSLGPRRRVPRQATEILNQTVEQWARSLGHHMIAGNTRLKFPTRAAGKYGFKPLHLVVGKILD